MSAIRRLSVREELPDLPAAAEGDDAARQRQIELEDYCRRISDELCRKPAWMGMPLARHCSKASH